MWFDLGRTMNKQISSHITTSHWGAFEVTVEDGRLVKTLPLPEDPNPSDIARVVPAAVHHATRIDQPYARTGWLDGNASTRRGEDEFVPVSWDDALDLAAKELNRVRQTNGNGAIYGGSYGWASAGRFHHAQSQVHRFLNVIGGYVSSFASYSTGAAQTIIPHILGLNFHKVTWGTQNSWEIIDAHTDTLLMIGGINPKNGQVSMGGVTEHRVDTHLRGLAAKGKRLISVSPQVNDSPDCCEWLPVQPGTDVALMLALAFVLETEDLLDRGYLAAHATGYDKFRPYLLGESDGVPKTPEWASELCGIESAQIRALAQTLAQGRTLISVAWALQRAEHGEQPYWMATVLAAMLGQIGLPGGGIGFGYGAIGNVGNAVSRVKGPTFDQGQNPIKDFIPVSRIADMLLGPGEGYNFNGQARTYPDIKLVYWCGGNPFHHHQDLNRLHEAWQQPDTVIVNEPWWTPTAKRADIVFPATTQFEREDIGWAKGDPYLFHMPKMIEAIDQARDDYDIFAGLAERMQLGAAFTEGRDSTEWLTHLYDGFVKGAARDKVTVPDWDSLKAQNYVKLPLESEDAIPVPFAAFYDDPQGAPLATPSGKIEVFSETIAGFGYEKVAGHPVWHNQAIDPAFPLRLVSPQPRDKLHSQLQSAIADQDSAIPAQIVMHPADARARGLSDGSEVRVWNAHGTCRARLQISETILQGVVALPTGSWFDPDADGLDRAGNPNVLTHDRGTSPLGQGCAAHNVGVEVGAETSA